MTIFLHRIGYSLSNNKSYQIRKQAKRLLRKHFDLPRNSHSTVFLYADECELPVFGAFLCYSIIELGCNTSSNAALHVSTRFSSRVPLSCNFWQTVPRSLAQAT